MHELQLGAVESRFADLIWEHAPVSSAEIVKLAESQLHWKKSTTYTVLKRLCEKGLFVNDGGRVTALISRADFYAMQSEQFVEQTFDGSLPAFLAAFTTRKSLTPEEIDYLRRIVREHEED